MRIHQTTAAAALILLAACAAQPTAPTPAGAPAAPVASAPAARTDDAKYAEFVKYARTQGYRLVKADDKEYWCRDEAPLGSRLAKQSCLSEPTLAEMQRQAEDTRDLFRKGAAQTCPTIGCN